MSALVPRIVSNNSVTNQTTTRFVGFTTSAPGLYRLNAYYTIGFTSGTDVFSAVFVWTDDHQAWNWGPNSGPGVTGRLSQPMSCLVRAVGSTQIGVQYTVTAGAPSADIYVLVEDLN